MNGDVGARDVLPALDWQRVPLTGRVLIEASAGTGKTWNIGLLFVRLLLERELPVERILVTTFTDAAAGELRERLLERLAEAERWLDACVAGAAPAHDDAESLAAFLARRAVDVAAARADLRRVQLARGDFDRAPIATFHALCQRIQRDFPLESGAGFGGDELVDDGALLRECVEDFWRRCLAGDTGVTLSDALLGAGPDAVLRDVRQVFDHDALLEPADGAADLRARIEALRTPDVVAGLRRLAADASLHAPRRHALKDRLAKIAALLAAGEVDAIDARLLDCFSPDKIAEQQNPAAALPLAQQPLIAALAEVRERLAWRDRFARGELLAAAAAFCRAELPRRAQGRRVQTFALLIERVQARVCGADGTLASALADAFPAALVDEFQDIDARQFAILDRVYAGRGALLMIGDPKQAIYAFRGGDIAAYLAASAATPRQYSLLRNQRSSRALLAAMNALYAQAGDAFGDARIRYRAVEAAGRADRTPYRAGGVPVARPLVLHAFAGPGAPGGSGDLQTLALADCANRVAELLADPQRTIGTQRVLPSDVAVLVPNNRQVAELRRLLAARNVPCVGAGRGSVFDGDTARELELILYAVLHAEDDRAVRGALTTRLLGADFAQVLRWQADAAAFELEQARFEQWRERIGRCGILVLVGALIARRGAALLGAADGERTLTDLRHLGELLAHEEHRQQGLEGLYAWFAGARRDTLAGDEDPVAERRLRIESDAHCVQLLTVHASKGLEFGIVFLPLAWRVAHRGGKSAPGVLRFHDGAGRACLDVGSAQFGAHRAAHFREEWQERLRLLYVALTRARHAAHVYWHPPQAQAPADAGLWQVAAIDTLLGPGLQRAAAAGERTALAALAAGIEGVAFAPPWQGAPVRFDAPRDDARAAVVRAAPEPRALPWLHSFSGLVRSAAAALDAGAADEVETPASPLLPQQPESDDLELLELAPWRGPRFGDAVHAVFELGHATAAAAQRRAAIRVLLARHGVHDDAAIDGVDALVERVSAADLGAGLHLAGVAAADRVAEFEFQFPLQHAPVARLARIAAAHGYPRLFPDSLTASVLHGMLTGFVDLVFAHRRRYHVLDYKTNWLGARRSDYRAAALDAAMDEHHYALQAVLYTVALHRYLGQRVSGYAPERDLGDSWYLFVRGVGLAPKLGIWRRRWPVALIRALDGAFAGSAEAVA